jgi:hypothetical protein
VKPFECQGEWWIPGTNHKLWGTLTCDDEGNLNLTLPGRLVPSGPQRPKYGDQIETVHGRIVAVDDKDHDKFKGSVTLRHCFIKGQSYSSSGETSQKIYSHRGYFGRHITTEADFTFRSASLSYSGLAEWAAGYTGVNDTIRNPGGDNAVFGVAWQHREPIRCEFRGGTLLIGLGCSTRSGPSPREYVLHENVTFALDLSQPPAEAEWDSIIYLLQNFLTFAADTPNAMVDFRLRDSTPGRSEYVTVIGPRTYSDETEARDVMAYKMLFTMKAVENRLSDVFRRWQALSETRSEAIVQYFGFAYNPPRYSDQRFQQVAQILSLYVAGAGDLQTDATLPPDLRELVRTHPVVSAQRAVSFLVNKHRAVLAPLIGDGRWLIEATTTTTKYVLTRDASGRAIPDGGEFHWLTEFLLALWKVAVLGDLGFDDEYRRSLVEKHPRIGYLREHARPLLEEFFEQPPQGSATLFPSD